MSNAKPMEIRDGYKRIATYARHYKYDCQNCNPDDPDGGWVEYKKSMNKEVR